MGSLSPLNPDSLEPLLERLRSHDEQLRTLQRPTGTSIAGLVQQVQVAVANIASTIAASIPPAVSSFLSSGFTTGSMTATGNVNVGGTVSAANLAASGNSTAGGRVTASAGITSPGVYTTDVTALPGARTPVWVHNSGVLGQTISTITKKANLSRSLPFTAAQVLACVPYVYEYLGQIAIRDDSENEFYDPDYVVPLEIGMMAEHLIDNGLGIFVFYEADGITPKGIDYALFGAIANLVVLQDHESRLAAAGI